MKESVERHLLTVLIAAVTALVVGGGSVATAAIINATKLNGYRSNQLVRLAESHTVGPALLGTSGTIRSVAINAPKDGYLVMIASSNVWNSVDGDQVNCSLALDGTTLSASRREIRLDGDVARNTEENCATDSAWPVARGPHTVSFEATSVGVFTAFSEATLEVIFVPFDSSGKVPTPVAPVTPART